jgi:hypothetical protein
MGMKTNRCTSANWPLSSSIVAAYAMSGTPNDSPASSPIGIDSQAVAGVSASGWSTAKNNAMKTKYSVTVRPMRAPAPATTPFAI